MDLRKKIGLAVEAAEPPGNGQAPGPAVDEPLEAGVGAARKLESRHTEYNRLAHVFGLITIDARESINKIQAALGAHVSEYLRRAQGSVQPQADGPSKPKV